MKDSGDMTRKMRNMASGHRIEPEKGSNQGENIFGYNPP
jgi:hypothetical protein